MFGFLLPKETHFFDFFENHSDLMLEACKELVALCQPGADIAKHVQRIDKLEGETDSITHGCIKALQKTFITPFDRSHIHDLIKGLDDIVDAIDDASSRIVLYDIKEILPEARALAELILEAALTIGETLKHLRNLKNEPEIKKMCISVHRVENDADEILRAGIKRLFHEGDDIKLIIKWKEILENLELASDRCEDVADIIQGIVIEAS